MRKATPSIVLSRIHPSIRVEAMVSIAFLAVE
jgi:hypothetical protein